MDPVKGRGIRVLSIDGGGTRWECVCAEVKLKNETIPWINFQMFYFIWKITCKYLSWQVKNTVWIAYQILSGTFVQVENIEVFVFEIFQPQGTLHQGCQLMQLSFTSGGSDQTEQNLTEPNRHYAPVQHFILFCFILCNLYF